ncbi:nesprin-2 [Megalops cyprinoides]|uniref:nesprin-2 n=1 Tax=Megalops cyprinoides TaxID=118141 RepID=UPI0018647DEB|nr:nesprin-2 [Megalops cyprinoides]
MQRCQEGGSPQQGPRRVAMETGWSGGIGGDSPCGENEEPTTPRLSTDSYPESADSSYSECYHPTPPESYETCHDWPSVGCLSQDGTASVERYIRLEKKWLLWHEFMKAHSQFDDWLRLAEKTAASPNSAHVLYLTAKEELKKFESLQTETRARLLQLDGLNQQRRVLTRHFGGAMGGRLAGMARDCCQRWDRVSRAVDSICRRLKHFVTQREDFESQREEMAIWLADMDLRLTEVEHFSGKDTREKMHQLQSFQEAVGENAVRLNSLLERGEALIQRSEPADAQDIEGGLQELLLYCARVFEGVGQLHTRLLSMRLVFEEDWLLAPPPDSGCPSETPLEDEGVFERGSLPDLQAPRTPPSSDHLVLEWDPSVDVGGSVSLDDADSSYFSAVTGLHNMEEPLSKDAKRRSYLSTEGSGSDVITAGTPGKSTESNMEPASPGLFGQTLAPGTPSLCCAGPSEEGPLRLFHQKTSTPSEHSPEPVAFDPERISAWLGYIPTVQERRPCSKAVQTEHAQEFIACSVTHCDSAQRCPWPSPAFEQRDTPGSAQSLDCEACPDWTSRRRHPNTQSPEERKCQPALSEAKIDIEQRLEEGSLRRASCGPWPPGAPRFARMLRASLLLYVPVVLLLALFAWLPPGPQGPSCHRGNTLARSFHLMLHYVNGPPPT